MKIPFANTASLLSLIPFALLTGIASAAPIFSESFDYGETDLSRSAIGWPGGSSTRVFYDADGGLNVAQMNGETGGALGMPDLETTQHESTKSFSYSLSNIAADGGTVWLAAIVDYTAGTDVHGVRLGASVSGLGFNITTTGTLQLFASDNGGSSANHNTTVAGISSGTYLVVVRATKGSGTSPTNSTVDIWFNPADTSDVGSLGGASFTTGADSKWGRDTESYTGVTAEMGLGGAVDEIRVGIAFSDLDLATTTGPDTTAPSWASSYPQADTPTIDGFTLRAAINEPGTAYYVVVADGATGPSAAEVKAGTGAGGSGELASGSIALNSANIEGTTAITGLASDTDYDVYFVAEDDESPTPNLQADIDVQKVDISSLNPNIIFYESFDYGGSDLGFNSGSIGSWSSGSGVLKYDADGGLNVSTVNGETGGSMWLDFADARVASNGDPNFAYSSLGAGDEMWISYLVDFTTGGAVNSTLELAGGSVSGLLFTLTSTGNFNVKATLDSNVNYTETAGSLGTGVHHILFRATKGTGASPTDSQLDLWINPTDTTSVANLGAADWTLDSTDGLVKWGQDADTFGSISAGPSEQGRIDEIRITTTFSDLNLATTVSSNNFSDWISGFSGLGGQTGLNDDPDADGIDNGVENFFGTPPNAFSQGLIAGTANPVAGTFTFTHPQNANPATDLTATYQWSKDLQTFYPEGSGDGTTVAFDAVTAAGTTTVTATVTGTPVTKLFVNIAVSQN